MWGDSVWELRCDFWLGAKAPTLTNRVWGTRKFKGKTEEMPLCPSFLRVKRPPSFAGASRRCIQSLRRECGILRAIGGALRIQ